MDLPLEEYLKPTPTIDCGTRSIKEKAQELTNRQEKITEKARSLFYFVRDEIKYNPYSMSPGSGSFVISGSLAKTSQKLLTMSPRDK